MTHPQSKVPTTAPNAMFSDEQSYTPMTLPSVAFRTTVTCAQSGTKYQCANLVTVFHATKVPTPFPMDSSPQAHLELTAPTYVMLIQATCSLTISVMPTFGLLTWKTFDAGTDTNAVAAHENDFIEAGGTFYLIGGRRYLGLSAYDPTDGVWQWQQPVFDNFSHFEPVIYGDELVYILFAMTRPFPNETPIQKMLIYDSRDGELANSTTIHQERRRGGGTFAMYKEKFLRHLQHSGRPPQWNGRSVRRV